MTDAGTAPATKDDIRMLMDEFGRIWQWKADVDGKFADVDTRFNDLEEKMGTWKKELKDHFDLVAENIRYDFSAANREEIDVLKDGHKENRKRIVALERATGLAA